MKASRVIAGLAAFTVPLIVYVVSLNPGLGFWDTGEMQTVPYVLGIAHPPGFPAFVLLGYLFSHAFAFGSVAWRMNLFSAVAMSAAAWLLHVAVSEQIKRPWTGTAAACLFAFGAVAWTRGTRAEVHALAVAFEALTFVLAQRWVLRGSRRALAGAGIAYGLALATHPVAVWLAPGLALYAWSARRVERRLTIATVAATIAPLALYAYLPLRSAQLYAARVDPTLGLGLPPGRPFWDYGHPSTWHNFWWMVSGAQFPKHAALMAIVHPGSLWNALAVFAHAAANELTLPAAVLALAGLAIMLRRTPAAGFAWLIVAVLGVPFALAYTIEADKLRYLLMAFWMTALFAAIGADAILRVRYLAGCVVALLALALLWTNRGTFAQRHDSTAQTYVARVLAATPRNAVIVAPWVYATPIAYAAYVEHATGERTLVTADLNLTILPYFAGWLRTRPVDAIAEAPVARIGGLTFRVASRGTPLVLRVTPDRQPVRNPHR